MRLARRIPEEGGVGEGGGGSASEPKNKTRLVILAILLAACGDDGAVFPIEQLQDPTTCMECHPQHYEQWSGSMHAYASEDPVFLAMNKRGQRETGGKLGDFCVRCHAPMAVTLGLTDGQNFDPAALPPQARGVTCYFCHNVKQVTEDHNNGLLLALDQTMRGGARDPVSNRAHRSSFDPLMDSDTNKSELCGSCHDIVVPQDINNVPGGVAVERTFAEWKTTIFATVDDPAFHLTCGACHMKSKDDVIADAPDLDVPSRRGGFHEHMWPAIDQALTPFPQLAEQAAGIKRDLDPAIIIKGPTPRTGPPSPGGICLDPPGVLTVRIDSLGTGHSWPSGAALDRRAWLEVVAYRADDTIVFSTGVVPDGTDPDELIRTTDPNLFGLWDRTFKADNTPAHFFWEVARVDSQLLLGPTTLDQNLPAFDHSKTARFEIGALYAEIDRIEAIVKIRPLPFELIDDLVASGDLDPAIRARIPTLEVSATRRNWLKATKGTGPAVNTNCSPL